VIKKLLILLICIMSLVATSGCLQPPPPDVKINAELGKSVISPDSMTTLTILIDNGDPEPRVVKVRFVYPSALSFKKRGNLISEDTFTVPPKACQIEIYEVYGALEPYQTEGTYQICITAYIAEQKIDSDIVSVTVRR